MQKKVTFQSSRTLLLVIVLSLLGQMILPMLNIPTGVSATPIKKVNAFSDGTQYKDITFTSMGTDANTAKLSFQTGVAVRNASFYVDAQSNLGKFPSNISIDVGNNGLYEWQWAGLGYGAMGHQNLFILGGTKQNNTANLTLPGGGGNNDSATIRLPFGAKITNATMRVTVLGVSIAIECKTGSRGCSVPNTTPAYLLKSAFQEKGWTATIVTGTDINSVQKLSQYTVVVLGDTAYNDHDHTTFQTPLKNWVMLNGGGVVGVGFMLYTGITGSDLDAVIPVSGSYGLQYNSGLVSITNPNHPVTQGVNSFNVPASTYCEYPSPATVDAGAQSLGTCGSGPAIVVAQKGIGRGVYLGPTYFADPQYSVSKWYADPNGKKLIQQAALWASGGGYLTGFVDIDNDSTKEWSKTNYNGSEYMTDFSSSMNTYLASVAKPTFTDAYGNGFVDVPVHINATSAGLISLSNLTINYTYTAKVELNPHNQSLSNEINGIIPAAIGPKNVTIPIAVSSDTPGIVKIYNFNTDLIDPTHAPLITDYTPTDDLIIVDENTTADFKVTTLDWYRYPMIATWSIDSKKNTTGLSFSYYLTYESAGDHNVTVVVNNTLQDTQHSWTVRVRNVDRAPRIISYTPDLQVTMDENESKTFSVVAKDPDIGDPVGYTWTLDKVSVGSTASSYDYKPSYFDQGQHTLEVTAKDPKNMKATVTWDITVNDANAPPEIYSWSPKSDPTTPENSSLQFLIKAKTLDEDTLSYSWTVDGKTVPNEVGTIYKYTPNFDAAGTRAVQVDVTDGKVTVSHKWTVTVTNVNRPPIAVIASPKAMDEFLTTENITFSGTGSKDPDKDALTYDWYEGNVKVGTGETMKVKLPKGSQTIELRVSDGKDGLATANVRITVRALRFDVSIDIDNSAPKTGDSVKFKVQVKSIGDADGANLPVKLYIDGNPVQDKTITSISEGDVQNLEFSWTATEGYHSVSVVIAQDKADKSFTVQKPLIPYVSGNGNAWMFPMILIVVVVCVIVGAVAAVSRRRKKAKAQQAMAAAQTVPAPQTVQPAAQPAPTTPSSPYRLVPPPMQQPTSQIYGPPEYPPQTPQGYYQQPASSPASVGMPMPVMPPAAYGTERTLPEPAPLTSDVGVGIESELQSTEAAVESASASGKDVAKARNLMRLAKFFANKGDQAKAMDYCKKAKESIR
jgi:hypothetical protein